MSQFQIFDPGSPSRGRPIIAGVIVCRLDSTRLPGKVLKRVDGQPLLKWVYDRVATVESFDQVIVATSDRQVDDPIANFCEQHELPVFRGDAFDLSNRILQCSRQFGFDWFARINADSPFVDPDLLSQAIDRAQSDRYDFVTNLSPRSFPYGVSAELVRTSTFEKLYQSMNTADEREHVTKKFYDANCRVSFRKHNLLNPAGDQSQIHLTVDTTEDWETFQTISESQDCHMNFRMAIEQLVTQRKAA